MDRDAQGVRALVIKRDDQVLEEIRKLGQGVVERSFSVCGDYSAHCVLNDGSLSAACEFAVCDLDFSLPDRAVSFDESWEIPIKAGNMKPIIVHLNGGHNSYGHHNIFITDEDRRNGQVVIPAGLIRDQGEMQVWLIGENRYGRLKKCQDILIEK